MIDYKMSILFHKQVCLLELLLGLNYNNKTYDDQVPHSYRKQKTCCRSNSDSMKSSLECNLTAEMAKLMLGLFISFHSLEK